MTYLALGIIAFLLFYIYEVHTVTGRYAPLKLCFFTGIVLILFSTCAAVVSSIATMDLDPFRVAIFGIFAVFFLVLLLYSLFFAVPFSSTYIKSQSLQKKTVCRIGMYALCRHPGVLWFSGFYLFLWLSFGGQLLLLQFLIYCSFNLLYIFIQDKWSFLKCFDDYLDYKKNTPFLIPNKKSIQRCFETLKSHKEDRK